VFPELFATLAVPKAEELIASPYRHGNKQTAEAFFLRRCSTEVSGVSLWNGWVRQAA